jgi:hypothetical protein
MTNLFDVMVEKGLADAGLVLGAGGLCGEVGLAWGDAGLVPGDVDLV